MAHGGLGSPASVIHQENAPPQVCPEASLLRAFPQLKCPLLNAADTSQDLVLRSWS